MKFYQDPHLQRGDGFYMRFSIKRLFLSGYRLGELFILYFYFFIDKKSVFEIIDCRIFLMESGMKKIKLYLDTSVISALDDPKKPERMQETHLLWEDIKADKYEIVISFVLIDEVEKCKQPKRDKMYDFLSTIKYEKIEANETIQNIADEVFKLGILPKKSRNDRLHIGSALVSSCSYIISWNFKHLVKIKTVNGVRAITSLYGYNPIDIIAPSSLIY